SCVSASWGNMLRRSTAKPRAGRAISSKRWSGARTPGARIIDQWGANMRDLAFLVRTVSLVGTLTLFAVSGHAADPAPAAFRDRVTLPVKENAHAVLADDLHGN